MIDPSLHFHHVPCDLCGTRENTPFLSPQNIPAEITETLRVVRCNRCGLLYTDPRPDAQSITRLYRKYYDSSGGQGETGTAKRPAEKHRRLRRLWHSYCGQYLGEVLDKAGGRVLDVGCGTGGLLDELQRAGCEAYGVELNPDSVKTCLKKGLNVKCGDLATMDFPDEFFDAVLLWHALEHLPSPKDALAKIKRLLKPGGRVFIYSPNAESYLARYFSGSWWAWQIPFHFYHFSTATIRRLCVDIGYTVVKCGSKTPEYFIARSIAAKLADGHSRTVFRVVPPAFFHTLLFRLIAAPVFRVLDFLMPERGECLTVELKKADGTSCSG